MPWQVEILNHVVADEIAALPADIQERFARLKERIGSVGLEGVGPPIVRPLEGSLWELRMTGRDGLARALHVAMVGLRVVVVRAFVKGTKQSPRADIDLALERARDIR